MTVITNDFEAKLRAWAKPPSTSEEQRCQNAENAIKNALKASPVLKDKDIRIFTQGSYANNTNVRSNSDVDIGVVCTGMIFPRYPDGLMDDHFGLYDSSYTYAQFKADIENALRSYFGFNAVVRGSKAFDLGQNSYRVEADVAPFFEYRSYSTDGSYLSGVKLISDTGTSIINWPDQHLRNGRDKNTETGGRYKSIARVLKKISIELNDPAPGFLIESMVWNAPNACFGHSLLNDDLLKVLLYLYQNIRTNVSDSWTEVSQIKYLFGSQQKWSKQVASDFIDHAYDYSVLP